MSIVSIICLVICLLTLLQDALLLAGLLLNFKKPAPAGSQSYPRVAVFVAARNEEHTLGRCLDSLLRLNYPKEKLDIYIGNDASDDNTLRVAEKYAAAYPHIHAVNVEPEKTGGKARVLADICARSQAPYLLFTDADVAVPAGWVYGLLSAFDPHTGMVIGVTHVEPTSFLAAMQRADWALAQGMLKVVSDLRKPVTGMGNNMAISKKAYQASGGFQAFTHSIVEDFDIFRAIDKLGFKVKHLVAHDVAALTLPVGSFAKLLHQRKRWMYGARRIHIMLRIMLFLQALYYPAFIALLLFHPLPTLAIGLCKVLLQSAVIGRFLRYTQSKFNIISALLFDFYSAILSLTLIIFYALPIRINWKNRNY